MPTTVTPPTVTPPTVTPPTVTPPTVTRTAHNPEVPSMSDDRSAEDPGTDDHQASAPVTGEPPAAVATDSSGSAFDRRAMFVGLFLDAGLAVITYLGLHLAGASDFVALLSAAVVAALRAGYVIVRRREIDGFAVYMIFVFTLGLVLSFVTGSARFLLIKDSIGTAASGLAFLVTCLVGKPLMYYAAQRFAAPTLEERNRWNALWPVNAGFRRHFRTMSVVWGIAFLAEAALRLALVLLLPIPVTAVVSPIMTPALIVGLVVWSSRYSARYQARQNADPS